ncbi:hypothetical protein JVT61DRAFT_12117 [Boletus reticuloceps]|uniref:Uncharacterized protein n=1 Tax=Boletus reticuloceps TaxID=495285 RepID=A0A8I3A414_9AGAM|nr:hypothetical protein JVT61DRAFT_12117 [Boletus reticuloceps]
MAARSWTRRLEFHERAMVRARIPCHPVSWDGRGLFCHRKFGVNGSTLRFVGFDVGPSWAGLLPISNNSNETRQDDYPSQRAGTRSRTRGGPVLPSRGFSKKTGLVLSWSYGQAKPRVNEYRWTNLFSVLWVEQPVGTGFSQGAPNIQNEDQLAEQLVGFLRQFLKVFSD